MVARRLFFARGLGGLNQSRKSLRRRREKHDGRRRFVPQLEALENRLLLTLSTVFEIDGNAIQTVAGSHDWNQVYSDKVSHTLPANSAGTRSLQFVTDPTNSQSDTTFTSTSKDINDISTWGWKSGKPQSKADLAHGFAAAYQESGFATNGDVHTFAYVGADRWDNSGNTTIGIWFLRNPIALSTTSPTSGTFVNKNGGAEVHAIGDVLFVANFGSGSVDFTAYRWTASGLSTAAPLPANQGIAAVNTAATSVPWPFTAKNGATSPQSLEFFEAGCGLE